MTTRDSSQGLTDSELATALAALRLFHRARQLSEITMSCLEKIDDLDEVRFLCKEICDLCERLDSSVKG